MFRKLRNRLIIINLSITSVVIIAAFAFIYFSSIRHADERPPMPENSQVYSSDVEDFIEVRIEYERKQSANQLLMTLIFSGVAIEIIVALLSYYLAELSIKPVREAYGAQKIFIANASHEIKTPLAAISANLEAADIHGNKWIKNVEKETEKLTILNNSLLALARTDIVSNSVSEEVSLSKLIQENLKSLDPKLDKIKFEKDISTDTIKVPIGDFSQIFNILIDNAIKYCDKKIILKANAHKLIIKNDGAKIPARDLPHIFERFYQADKTADGVGLGLSIAKATAERNGWNLSVKCEKYTSFIFEY